MVAFLMRWLVTGSREGVWGDLWVVLDQMHRFFGVSNVLVGDASGIDAGARAWCESMNVSVAVYVAQWDTYGVAAGPRRNAAMVADAEVGDICLAFPSKNSRGTWDCVRKAKKAGLAVLVYQSKPSSGTYKEPSDGPRP